MNDIPSFPDFKQVGLEDGDCLRDNIRRFPSEVCEMSFGNTLIWRNFDHPRLTFIHDNLCILFEPPDEPAYFIQPVGGGDIPETLKTCLSFAPRLSRIPAAFAERYCAGFECAADRNNFDYVYLTSDLIELKGKKYDGKRNRIKKFERNHSHRYIKLAAEHLQACRTLFEEWLREKTEPGPMVEAQGDAIREALTHFETLGLSGGAIEVEGSIAAFSIGEPLNADTAVIHIEIVSPKYDGLAQVMNREFVRNEMASFAFVNREQDLGIAGLRRAKTSYHPHHLVEKYHIWSK
jgi:hypothetical protein